jgi:hypothetical protein
MPKIYGKFYNVVFSIFEKLVLEMFSQHCCPCARIRENQHGPCANIRKYQRIPVQGKEKISIVPGWG